MGISSASSSRFKERNCASAICRRTCFSSRYLHKQISLICNELGRINQWYDIFCIEQTQFDNPVYAYQGSSKFDDGTTTLLNNFQFRNNLGTSKKINNEKAKLGMNSCTDDEDDCKGIIENSIICQRTYIILKKILMLSWITFRIL